MKVIKYAVLQNNPLFRMAPLFPNNTVPGRVITLCDCIRPAHSLQPAVSEHTCSQLQVPLVPTLYVKAKQSSWICHTQWLVYLHSLVQTKLTELTALNGKTPKTITSFTKRWVTSSTTAVISMQQDASCFEAQGGTGRRKLLIFRGVRLIVIFLFKIWWEQLKKKIPPARWNVWKQHHMYNIRESVRKVHAKRTKTEVLLILEGQIFFSWWNQ